MPQPGKGATVPLDPESALLLHEILPRHGPQPGMTPDEMRAAATALAHRVQGDPPPVGPVRDHHAPTPAGQLPLRSYAPLPAADGKVPGLVVWLHGGGFTTGGLDTHDTLCRQLCAQSGQVIVSVDYRLAPEHRFPAAVEDSLSVLVWAADHAATLGARPGALAVGGSSAGGNLAAAVCLMARDRGGPAIRHQALVYPVVDATMRHDSYRRHATGYQLTSAAMAGYLANYMSPGLDPRTPRLSPLFAPTLVGLPPAHVVSAELDPLADEVAAYADRLEAAGLLLRHDRFDGAMHGFFGQAGVLAKARAAQAAVCSLLAVALAP